MSEPIIHATFDRDRTLCGRSVYISASLHPRFMRTRAEGERVIDRCKDAQTTCPACNAVLYPKR